MDILVRLQWSTLLSEFHHATQRRQEEERCRKVGQNEKKDPVNKSGGKAKKKTTWSKGKVWGKLNNLVLFDKATYDKLCKELPNYKLIIAPAVVSERLKIHSSFLGQGSPPGTP